MLIIKFKTKNMMMMMMMVIGLDTTAPSNIISGSVHTYNMSEFENVQLKNFLCCF